MKTVKRVAKKEQKLMKTKTAAAQKKKRKKEKLQKAVEKEINSNRKKRAKLAVFSISVDPALQFEGFEERVAAPSFDDYVYFQI